MCISSQCSFLLVTDSISRTSGNFCCILYIIYTATLLLITVWQFWFYRAPCILVAGMLMLMLEVILNRPALITWRWLEVFRERKPPPFKFTSPKLHFIELYFISLWLDASDFDLYQSLKLPVSVIVLEIFNELNQLHSNFCRDCLWQFWTELFAKWFLPFDLYWPWPSHSKYNRLVPGLWPTIP